MRRLLALLLVLAAGSRGPAMPAPSSITVTLLAGELLDPDQIPPDLLVPLEGLAASGLAPVPASAVVKKTGVSIDWDGDGKTETNVRAGGAALVRVAKGERRLALFVLGRGDAWWVGPAMVLATKSGAPFEAMLLDADLDGRFDGEADRVRFEGGAFMRIVEPRRVQRGLDLLRWRLEQDAGKTLLRADAEEPPAGVGPIETLGLAAVNEFRSRCGLAPLTLDAEWCRGCKAHATYITLNPEDGFGHSETPGRPGFSQAGLTAAIEGVMERTGSPRRAVESLTAMMLHRTPFLADPSARVGVGSSAEWRGPPAPEPVEMPGFCVLRAGVALTSHAWPVTCPGPGQKDVPLLGKAEVPEPDRMTNVYAQPRGYPISVSFLGAEHRPVRITLHTAKGQLVDGHLFTPREPVHASFAHNYATAFLLPKEPLAPRTVHEVEVVAGEGVAAKRLLWRFTTGSS
jgi:hypothetical protein